MIYLRLFFLIVVLSFFVGCSYKNRDIGDLKKIPQDANYFVSSLDSEKIIKTPNLEKFKESHFAPWLDEFRGDTKNALWGLVYLNRDIYGENRLKIELDRKRELKESIDIESFPNSNQFAISVKNSDLRVLPSNKPAFYSFKRAGEGYPFDYFQNSSIHIYTPLRVWHITKDREWAYVESGFVGGFIKSSDIAYIKNPKKYIDYRVLLPREEGVVIYNSYGEFIERLKIGALILESEDGVAIGFIRDIDGSAKEIEIKDNKNLKEHPLEFKERDAAHILNQMVDEKYGWGGSFGNRDCSSMLRDYFLSFGFYLPRNSLAQSRYEGGYVDISHLGRGEKKKYIIDNATPFLSFLYSRGHIMLYVGEIDGEPIIFHNMWGVRIEHFLERRHIVGRALFSTLSPGSELVHINKSGGFLIDRIIGINLGDKNDTRE